MQSAVTILARRFHRNQQYSIIALTNGGGTITERYAYDAYGTPTITDAAGTTLTTSVDNNRYTYTGREFDEALGLYHYRARMYDSVAGRFCSRDPIGFEGSKWNLYEYADGMPLIRVDPTGEACVPCAVVIAAAAALARKLAVQALKKAWGTCKKIRCKRLEIHKAHHKFPLLGKKCHVQMNCWLKGVKGKKAVVRIPVPDWACP